MAFKLYASRRSPVCRHYSLYEAGSSQRNGEAAKKILEETENTLAAFLLELKEENEKLIEHPIDLSAGKDRAGQEKDSAVIRRKSGDGA